MSPLLDEPAISRFVRKHDEPGIEVRVNFGVFAGRHATPAEIDELAAALRELVPAFAIVAEDRHEFAAAVEASVHQVVIEVPQEHAGSQPDVLAEQIVLAANGWALDCIASRHGAGEL
jgi:Na+-transporting methylmalonyl-CoA/oxaloacetate decarboxylase gamma subunit